jgi:hypothetical protein
MKKVNKFLLLFAMFSLTGSMASVMAQSRDIPTSILGEYVGTVHVTNGDIGMDETLYDITVELKESAPNYALTIAEADLGNGLYLPEYELDDVNITESGSKYLISKSGSLHFIIPEIEIPGLGTLTNVPVDITLNNGSIEGNEMVLNIKALATIIPIIFVITINIDFDGMLPPPPDCDPVTNAKAQIENCETATITWNAVDGAVGYEVTRDGNVKTVTAPPYTEDFAFEHGKTYTWTIKTICDQNEAPEVSASAIADCGSCKSVTNATAQIENCEKATITWTAADGAKEYKVTRDGSAKALPAPP